MCIRDREEAARAMKEQDSRRESIFRQSVEAQKHASELLEKKFQEAVKKAKDCLLYTSGPPSGQSTTVTFTYEIVGKRQDDVELSRQEAWNRLRGSMKDIFAEYGGGEAYLRAERASFRDADDEK